jgi:nitrate/nitrite transporter NarK
MQKHLRDSPLVDGRISVLGSVGFGWVLILGIRLVVPALFPSIKAEFVFKNTIAGSIYTVLLGVAALLQFPGGVIADRVGAARCSHWGSAPASPCWRSRR